nr:homeodomain-only protein isoform X2 [Caretta caretta]
MNVLSPQGNKCAVISRQNHGQGSWGRPQLLSEELQQLARSQAQRGKPSIRRLCSRQASGELQNRGVEGERARAPETRSCVRGCDQPARRQGAAGFPLPACHTRTQACGPGNRLRSSCTGASDAGLLRTLRSLPAPDILL